MNAVEEQKLFDYFIRYAIYLMRGIEPVSPATKEAVRLRFRMVVNGKITKQQFINFMEGLSSENTV